MKKTTYTIIGAIAGLPLSYFFQPEMVKDYVGGLAGYIKHFADILDESDLYGNVVAGVVVFGLVGLLIGYFIDKNEAARQ